MRTLLIQIPDPNDPEKQIIYKISGSFVRSLITNTLIAYSARGLLSSFSTPISAMTHLNPSLKSLLAISPLLANVFIPIPISIIVHRNGGKKEVLLLVGISLIGMTCLTIVSATTNLATIDSFDWRYGLMLTSGVLIGHGAAAFQLMIDTLKWTPNRNRIPPIQTLYSFVIDSASVTTPIIIYYMQCFGYYAPFTLFSGLLLMSELSSCAFFNPSPYNQYKTVFPKVRARELAIEAGQLESVIGDYDNIPFRQLFNDHFRVLWDRRSLLLGFSLIASLGSAWVTKLILPTALIKGYGFSQGESIITSSLGYLLAILSRPLADLITKKFDSDSGGIKVHLLGCALTISGGIALTQNMPRWGLFLSMGSFNMGYGFNMITPMNIAIAWSKPTNEHLNEVSPSNLFGLFTSLGSLGGILLPLLLGFMVGDDGSEAYKNYFYIIVSMMLVSAICVPIVNYQVNKDHTDSFFRNSGTFFGGARTLIRQEPQANNRVENQVRNKNKTYLEQLL